jgi:hypothetical protein
MRRLVIMSDTQVTTDKIELSEQKTRNYVLYGALIGLLILVQGFFTYLITSTGAEMRETNRNLVEVNATMRVMQTQYNYLKEAVEDLKAAKKDATALHAAQDKRLQAVEQSIALHNQWIENHNK